MDFYKSKKYLSILAIILMICWLITFDYSDFSWKANALAYLGITSMVLLLVSQQLNQKKNS